LKEKVRNFLKYLKTKDGFVQTMIAILGLTTGILLAYKIKWAFLFGILNQPFWFYFSIKGKHRGVTILNCFYLIIWFLGFYNWFFVK
jgi:nicotinamide riboside transporter PnuC